MKSMLAKLKGPHDDLGGGVLRVELSVDKKTLVLKENCDQYYREDLTKADVRQLARELHRIADGMVGL